MADAHRVAASPALTRPTVAGRRRAGEQGLGAGGVTKKSTLEDALDQYDSMIEEKTVAGTRTG